MDYPIAPFSPDPFGGLRVVQLCCGQNAGLCLLEDGSAWFWGRYGYLPPEYLTRSPFPTKLEIKGSPFFVKASMGFLHTVLLTDSGKAWFFGSSRASAMPESKRERLLPPCPMKLELADGTNADELFFVDVSASGDASSGKTSLRTIDGAVYCFGANYNFGCSVKKPSYVYKPVKVSLSGKKFSSNSSGAGGHTVLIADETMKMSAKGHSDQETASRPPIECTFMPDILADSETTDWSAVRKRRKLERKAESARMKEYYEQERRREEEQWAAEAAEIQRRKTEEETHTIGNEETQNPVAKCAIQ